MHVIRQHPLVYCTVFYCNPSWTFFLTRKRSSMARSIPVHQQSFLLVVYWKKEPSSINYAFNKWWSVLMPFLLWKWYQCVLVSTIYQSDANLPHKCSKISSFKLMSRIKLRQIIFDPPVFSLSFLFIFISQCLFYNWCHYTCEMWQSE